MVVDDDPTLRSLVALGLENLGYEVVTAESGQEALELLEHRTPDAVVTDLMMPSVDGLELCAAVRARPELQGLPFIVLTAKNYETDRLAARQVGADAYLQKPLDLGELDRTLRQLVANDVVVEFWGVRGTLPAPARTSVRYGGNTNCVCVDFPRGERLIFDAGSGIRPLGEKVLTEGGRQSAAIMITHPHWDHINALPFFAPLYVPGNQFQICGPAQPGASMRDLVAGQMDGRFFPITPREFGADLTYTNLRPGNFQIQGVEVAATLLMHPGNCLGYRVTYDNRTIAYITDQELSAPGFANYNATYIAKMVRFLDGVDILITDTTYTDAEYKSKVQWGHSSVSQVADLAHRANVGTLCMVHHDPAQTDDDIDRKLEAGVDALARMGSSVVATAPAEGQILRI
jgi:CheY-like chemotaxis protein